MTVASTRLVTIVARNYLSRARVLAESLRATNPGCILDVLVVDAGSQLPDDEPALHWIAAEDLPLDRDELQRMAFIYDVTELCTALKPWVLEMMLDEGADAAVYLDPDIAVTDTLDPVLELARSHSILLTPHYLEPMPRDGLRPSEADLAAAGVYNLGFIAVRSDSREMLAWWQARLKRDCLVAFDRQVFVDQRWIDQVPALFPCHIVTDPGCNVAYWNLHERRLTRVDGRLWCGDVPLRFFHFSGLEPHRPWVLSKYVSDRPRIVMSEHPLVAELCDWYLARLGALAALDDGEYGFATLEDGTVISPLMRAVYRDALLLADGGDEDFPPRPFGSGTAARLRRWFREPAPRARMLGRLAAGLWKSRPDLQHAFPYPDGEHFEAYTAWLRTQAPNEETSAADLLVDPMHAPNGGRVDLPRARRSGVNLSGYLTAALGIGESARLALRALDAAGIEVATKTFAATSSRLMIPHEERGTWGDHATNLVFVNADQFPLWTRTVGAGMGDGRYTIGVWFWELEHLPEYFRPSLELVDEVWVGSEFIRRALAKISDKPVYVMPMAVEPATPGRFDRRRYGLPDRPMFLFMFDHFSTIERKNPAGVIDAFCRAFADDEGPILVIKTINGDVMRADRERLRFAARGRSDIFLLEDYLSADDNLALLADATCYVSLHRSEGFGLTLAESMALGVPVIATAYSGNVDFMTRENSLPVPYTMVPVPDGCGPYPSGGQWAEPDVHAAARAMRRVIAEPEWAARLGQAGRRSVRGQLSVERATVFMRERIRVANARVAQAQLDAAGANRARIEKLDHAKSLITSAPAVDTPARFPAARLLRRLVYRGLRHHDEQEALRLAALADAAESIGDDLATVRGDLAFVRSELASASQARRADASAFELEIARNRETLAELERIATDHREARAQLHRLMLEVREDAESELAELRDDLLATTARLATLKSRVRADPYRSDMSALRVVGPDGEERMGYVGAGGAYVDFEDIFRGSQQSVAEGLKAYIDLLVDQYPVVDLGCGRGELLALLGEHGIDGYGVDLDEGMLAGGRERGLDVRREDLFDHLRDVTPGSLGAVVAIQVVEHLPVERLRELFDQARAALRPDGIFVVETVNPHAIDAFKSFWIDLTHVRPLYPESLLMLCQEVGFPRAEVMFPRGTGELESDLDEQGSYAVIARRSTECL